MCILQADFRWPFRGSLTSAFHLGCIGIPRGNGSPLHRWVSAVRYGCLWDIPPFLLSLRPPVLPSCLVVFWHTLASFCQNAASSGLFQCHLAIFSVPFGCFSASFPSVSRPKQRLVQDYPTRSPSSYTPSFTRECQLLLKIPTGGVGCVGDSRKFLWGIPVIYLTIEAIVFIFRVSSLMVRGWCLCFRHGVWCKRTGSPSRVW